MAGLYTGAKWGDGRIGTSGGQVTWSFAALSGTFYRFDAAIVEAPFRAAIQTAFDVWETVADIDFVRLGDGRESDIGLGWDAIDGRGSTVGQASWSYDRSGTTAEAEIRFDTAETWTVGADAVRSGVDFLSTAVHEIGHAIGLGHVEDADSIMYAYVQDRFSGLEASDVEAIQALYGTAKGAASNPAPAPTAAPTVPSAIALTGTDRADSLAGGGANDRLEGRYGDDTLRGRDGDDHLYGNQDDDRLHGDAGEDVLYGGKQDDVLFGGADDDRLFGNFDDDVLYGNEGEDRLHGGRGDDMLYGGQDDDVLEGGRGNDRLSGGKGSDLFVFGRDQGLDHIADFRYAEGDRLDLQGQRHTVRADGDELTLDLAGGGTIVLDGFEADDFSAAFII